MELRQHTSPVFFRLPVNVFARKEESVRNAAIAALRCSQDNHGAVVVLGFGAGEIVQSRQQALQKF